jgi:hypothetical protein
MRLLYPVVIFMGAVGLFGMLLAAELDLPLPRWLRRLTDRGLAATIAATAVAVGMLLFGLAVIDAAIPDNVVDGLF